MRVYESADECFKVARAHVENVLANPMLPERLIPELNALAKVCVMNGVYAAQKIAAQRNEKGTHRKTATSSSSLCKPSPLSMESLSLSEKTKKQCDVEVEFTVHPQFPTFHAKKRHV